MHQPFDCGNFRSKLENLREQLDVIEHLINFASATCTSDRLESANVEDARKALEEIRKEL